MSEFIVEFDYMCVKYIAKLQKFKPSKYWFGVFIIPAACNYSNNFFRLFCYMPTVKSPS